MADPKSSTQEDTNQANRRGVPPMSDEEEMRRSAETGEGEVPGENPEAEELEEELPSNRSQKRGGP